MSVIAALVTVLGHAVHHPSDSSGVPTQDEMRAYRSILSVLEAMAQRSHDGKLEKAKDLCMSLFSKVDASRSPRPAAGGASGNPQVSGSRGALVFSY